MPANSPVLARPSSCCCDLLGEGKQLFDSGAAVVFAQRQHGVAEHAADGEFVAAEHGGGDEFAQLAHAVGCLCGRGNDEAARL